jgi:Mycothiol maleylpyruvate isomerase N-terminal domain
MTSMSSPAGAELDPMTRHLEAERSGWYELAELVRSLTPEECVTPGYYRDPDWSVRDLVAHLGTWLAEAESQFERMTAGTYEGHGIDVDALNARLLAAMEGQPWEVAWVQANAGRTRMLDEWLDHDATDEVIWWLQKSGGDHYADHLERLRAWATELIEQRPTDTSPAR